MSAKIHQFNEFRLDVAQKNLRKHGQIVAIQPRVFDVLAVFVRRNNELISRAELMKEVWGDTFVEETSLRLCIHALRKIFDGRFIETVPKRGYRFNAEVKEISDETTENKTDFPADASKINAPKTYSPRLVGLAVLAIIVGVSVTFFWVNKSKTGEKMTIAVLPFTETGEKSDINRGVSEAVTSQLTQLKDFQILPSGSSETTSDYILYGSFRRENETLKVSAYLQKTGSKETLWTENFEVTPDQETGTESLIAARLARLFSLKMVEYDDEKAAKMSGIKPEALEAFLSARKIWRSRELGRVNEMSSLFLKAVELEPDQAFIKAAHAESLLMDDFSVTNYEKAEITANSVLETDAKQFGALTVLGQAAVNKHWNFDQAESYFKKAVELNSNYASTYNEYAKLLTYRGSFDQAEKMSKKALEIEPFSPLYNTTLCEIYYFDRKIDAALKQCRFAMQLEPNFWLARKQLFWIYVYKKMNKEVGEMITEKFSDEEKLKLPYFKTLQTGSLDEYWKHTIARSGAKAQYLNAMMYVRLNEKEKALESLENASENKEWLSFRLASDPIFEPLWNEDRFIKLQRRLLNK